MTGIDQHVEAARLQREISEILGMSLNQMVFDYVDDHGKIRLDLVTVNAAHRQSFLFHQSFGASKIEALNEMLHYCRGHLSSESTFTVQWAIKGKSELQTSYFRAPNIQAAMEKFYHGQDPNTFVVFSIVLNPIA